MAELFTTRQARAYACEHMHRLAGGDPVMGLERVDLGVHLLFDELHNDRRIEPYATRIREHLATSERPLIAAISAFFWDEERDLLRELWGGHAPLFAYKTAEYGPGPKLHGPHCINQFILDHFNPDMVAVFGAYLGNLGHPKRPSPEGCVGHAYRGVRRQMGPVRIDLDLSLQNRNPQKHPIDATGLYDPGWKRWW